MYKKRGHLLAKNAEQYGLTFSIRKHPERFRMKRILTQPHGHALKPSVNILWLGKKLFSELSGNLLP